MSTILFALKDRNSGMRKHQEAELKEYEYG